MDEETWLLQQQFARYGLTGLIAWIDSMVVEHGDSAGVQIATQIYDRPEYQQAFPAMAALRQQGMVITEAQYKATEQTYKDALHFYGLAGSPYDSQATYTRLMESQVSPRELEARLDDARSVAQATDPNIRLALTTYYGINANDLMIYALDPKGHGKDHVERLARSATVAGIAETTRLGLSRAYSESLAMDAAMDNRTEAEVREMLNSAAQVKATQGRLASIEDSGQFSGEDAVDITVKKDAAKTLASQARARRERARFAGSSGITTGSLRGVGV